MRIPGPVLVLPPSFLLTSINEANGDQMVRMPKTYLFARTATSSDGASSEEATETIVSVVVPSLYPVARIDGSRRVRGVDSPLTFSAASSFDPALPFPQPSPAFDFQWSCQQFDAPPGVIDPCSLALLNVAVSRPSLTVPGASLTPGEYAFTVALTPGPPLSLDSRDVQNAWLVLCVVRVCTSVSSCGCAGVFLWLWWSTAFHLWSRPAFSPHPWLTRVV